MTETPLDERRQRQVYLWVELIVVLLVCVVRGVFSSVSIVVWFSTGWSSSPFLYRAIGTLIHAAADIALILFVIWRSGDPLARFGLKRFRIVPDLLGGGGVFALTSMVGFVVWFCVRLMMGRAVFHHYFPSGYSTGSMPPSNAFEYALLLPMTAAIGLSEELVMRAYLIPRLEELLESTAIAVFLSSVMFACWHGYEGLHGFISSGLAGAVLGTIFCVYRRFAPLAVAHTIQDLIAMIIRFW